VLSALIKRRNLKMERGEWKKKGKHLVNSLFFTHVGHKCD